MVFVAFKELYEIKRELGGGAFGTVRVGREKFGERRAVALKQVDISSKGGNYSEAAVPIGVFREIQALCTLSHPNVVKLLDYRANGVGICLVMELADMDLSCLLRKGEVEEGNMKYILKSILQGVTHCHSMGIMHRDLKPSNILLWYNGSVKLADFGLARTFLGPPGRLFSHQVCTRWYRAPEILFGSRSYSEKIDIWAIGVMIGEMLLGSPIFPGENDIDQIYRVMQVIGSPSQEVLHNVFGRLPDAGKITFPNLEPIPDFFGPGQFKELVSQTLSYDPELRPSASKLLQNKVFVTAPYPRFSIETS